MWGSKFIVGNGVDGLLILEKFEKAMFKLYNDKEL
jgi:hypothetical protein